MEEPNRLDRLYNFPARDILIPSLKVGALSGKVVFLCQWHHTHTLLYHQHPAFVLMDILTVPSLLFAMFPSLFKWHYMRRRTTSILEVACDPFISGAEVVILMGVVRL